MYAMHEMHVGQRVVALLINFCLHFRAGDFRHGPVLGSNCPVHGLPVIPLSLAGFFNCCKKVS